MEGCETRMTQFLILEQGESNHWTSKQEGSGGA
jgi:hypothetical protein